ncbi:MAG: OB-fold domain-containing protein [Pseudomonadota bacterium]|nr:OB-fold domain-containing protein [Pseudomonadota bacterium]
MVGITRYGGYVPRLRLQRKSVVEANGWFNPALAGLAKGERAMCNWDEDSLTMAVEAGRDCMGETAPADLRAVYFASTTMPFADRQNATIAATALDLGEDLKTVDITSSQRAGTSGLIEALEMLDGRKGQTLFLAADHRQTAASGAQELQMGDGAAAFTLGNENVVAEFLGGHQLAVDFVDHYRGQNRDFDYNWEERWIRDEGYLKIVPRALSALFAKVSVTPADVDVLVMPCLIRGVPEGIAKASGIKPEAVADSLQAQMGEAGTAHALIMLSKALQSAKPGQVILVIGWGQGCDVLLFRATDAIGSVKPFLGGVDGYLARKRAETNYNRYLAFNDLIDRDKGIRAETDAQTALTTLYRKRDMVLAFKGGRCTKCGTVQYPKSHICVNPNCGSWHTQEDYRFADVPCTVQSWTADGLTYSPDPPTHFGMVTFEGGGRLMADLTDVDKGSVEVGMPLRMVFRVKVEDERRGFKKYFWKAAPDHRKAG